MVLCKVWIQRLICVQLFSLMEAIKQKKSLIHLFNITVMNHVDETGIYQFSFFH